MEWLNLEGIGDKKRKEIHVQLPEIEQVFK
jgi:hypothetical protein